MIEKNGNLFDTDANYIGHGVNTMGLMGAGIAKTFRELFPYNYGVYKRACVMDMLKPGEFLVVPDKMNGSGDRKLIVNFASQEQPGADATYQRLFNSLSTFAQEAALIHRVERFGNKVAIPEIGCGIGGLKWESVAAIIETVELITPEIEFEVWHYGG